MSFIEKKEGIIMSKLVDEAVETLRVANDKMAQLSDAFCENIKTEPLGKPYLAYEISTLLQMYLSQMSGEEKVYEGPCIVDEQSKKVTIQDFEIRGNLQFEVNVDGEWIKGHRGNSQYGQVFCAKEKGTFILTSNYIGRVKLPLRMDNNNI